MKRNIFVALLITLTMLDRISQASAESLKNKLKENRIIPDVIDVAPQNCILVTYDSGVSVSQGNILTPTQVKHQPMTDWNADPNKFYTVIFIDPDVPSRANPTLREFRHWTVVNIPGQAIEEGDTLIEYVGSGPLEGTGFHRYIFLVFEQIDGIKDFTNEVRASKYSRNGRSSFSTRNFAKTYNLGNPIAVNFFQAEYDDYVAIVNAQLT